ncbi:MAG: carboxypeptidase regulatory-like domain-containing protein, partial [Myxococcales bacterium]|nr:carboxypeptidase regulatory-like domain-containing protein [Myxococcales bacterium]
MLRETRALLLVLSALISSGAFAVGDTTGGIVGSVGSGDANVAGATVTVRHVDTGQTRSVTTGSDGEFRIGTLAVGTYEVKAASAAGETTPETVEVHVGGNTALRLLIGAAMETVEVSAHRTHGLVDRYSTDAGVQLSVEELARLPVQRDIASVAMLA